MYLRIKPHNDILVSTYSDWSYSNEGDSGVDLFTPEIIIIPKDSLGNTIDLQISCEAFRTKEDSINSEKAVDQGGSATNLSYYLYPRSSISKTPLRLSNSVGIIDAGYRGNIIAKVDNLDRENDYIIEAGTRLFQICSPTLDPINIEVVNQLSESSRGSGGFGSTGR